MDAPLDEGYFRFVKALTPPVVASLCGARSLIWPSPTPKPTCTLLFIPGNPGLAEYYRTYLGEVHRLVNEAEGQNSLEIVCVSQLGHDPASDGFDLEHEGVVSVDSQIKHKASVLDSLAARWSSSRGPPPKIILGGHSIGAHMALEVVRRKLNTFPVDAVHLLFPTVHHIGQTPNADKLAWLFRAAAGGTLHPQKGLSSLDESSLRPFSPRLFFLLRVGIAFLHLIPFFIIKSLILLASPAQNLHAVRTTASLVLSPYAARQAIGMALDEMRSVTAVVPYPVPKDGGGIKIRAYWAQGDFDGWAPESARIATEEALQLSAFAFDSTKLDSVPRLDNMPDRASMVCKVGMPHAFCLEHGEAMAMIAATWILHDHPSSVL